MEPLSPCNNDSRQIELNRPGKFALVSPGAVLIILYILVATVACFMALQWLPASLVEGQYIPVGPDSFYHARRILDVIGGMEFYQFDQTIHAPEGSLLTWPWVYDWLMAKSTMALMVVFSKTDPMSVMVYIPAFWVYVNALLLTAIARSLNLSLPLTALVLLCFAFSPLIQELHGVGRIDHHYMELTMVLLVVLSGISWMGHTDSRYRAILFGLCLGFAPGINNGLFILQIPVVATMVLLWRQDGIDNKQNIIFIALSLVVATLLIVLPSLPFQQGEFSYYYLSWFHLYAACCSSVALLIISKARYSIRNLSILVVAGILAVGIVSQQVIMGSRFMLSGIVKYEDISETHSVLKQIDHFGLIRVIEDYSALLVFVPVILLYMAIRQFQQNNRQSMYFMVFAAFGLLFLLLQQRMHYFGSFVLFLVPFLYFDRYFPDKSKIHWAGLIIFIVACCLPVYGKLSAKVPYARSMDYTYTRQIFPDFAAACSKDPGIVLSEYDDGNYIRFHTDCSVIAMNSIITPQHQQKVFQVEKLFARSASELRQDEPWIKYIYVRRQDNIFSQSSLAELREKNPGLRWELLSPENRFPDGFSLVKELALNTSDRRYVPYARLFKVSHRME